jgi:hypothetical protein
VCICITPKWLPTTVGPCRGLGAGAVHWAACQCASGLHLDSFLRDAICYANAVACILFYMFSRVHSRARCRKWPCIGALIAFSAAEVLPRQIFRGRRTACMSYIQARAGTNGLNYCYITCLMHCIRRGVLVSNYPLRYSTFCGSGSLVAVFSDGLSCNLPYNNWWYWTWGACHMEDLGGSVLSQPCQLTDGCDRLVQHFRQQAGHHPRLLQLRRIRCGTCVKTSGNFPDKSPRMHTSFFHRFFKL